MNRITGIAICICLGAVLTSSAGVAFASEPAAEGNGAVFELVPPTSTPSAEPSPAEPSPAEPSPAKPSPTKPSPTEPGSYDPYVGLGDLNTKAIPVCCCSFGFCEETPNAPCTGGPPSCRCNSTGFACVHI